MSSSYNLYCGLTFCLAHQQSYRTRKDDEIPHRKNTDAQDLDDRLDLKSHTGNVEFKEAIFWPLSYARQTHTLLNQTLQKIRGLHIQ